MRAGVITDGISRDLPHALSVAAAAGLEQAELQFIGDKEVGDLDAAEIAAVRAQVGAHGLSVSCISRHLFAGQRMGEAQSGDAGHTRHMAALERCIDMAEALDCPLVRIMTGKKEMILWGSHGAEVWNVAKGAWEAQLPLISPAVDMARDRGATLVVETGNGTMVNSAWTARKLIDDLGAKDVLKVLWDPANALWAHEDPLEAYDTLADGYLGHLHVKDVAVDTPRARLEVRPMGQGQLAAAYPEIARRLRADGYAGGVSYESVYHPGDGDFEAGFRANIGAFLELFG